MVNSQPGSDFERHDDGGLAYPFRFDFPLPGVNAAASIPTRRNHDDWASLCRGDQEWAVGTQRAIIRS